MNQCVDAKFMFADYLLVCANQQELDYLSGMFCPDREDRLAVLAEFDAGLGRQALIDTLLMEMDDAEFSVHSGLLSVVTGEFEINIPISQYCAQKASDEVRSIAQIVSFDPIAESPISADKIASIIQEELGVIRAEEFRIDVAVGDSAPKVNLTILRERGAGFPILGRALELSLDRFATYLKVGMTTSHQPDTLYRL